MPALREPRVRTRLSNPQEPPPGMTTPSFGAGLTVADAVVSADFGTGHDQVARGDAAGGLPLTNDGDLLTRASGVLVRIPVGSEGKVFTVSGGMPSWATPGGGGSLPTPTTPGALLRVNAGATGYEEFMAYSVGHTWSRLSPSAAGGGAVFLDEDSRVESVSSGDDTIGWSVRLPTRLGAERCGLTMGSGSIRQVQDLSAFTANHTTLAVTFHWDGDTSGDFYGFCALGQRSGVGGVPTVGLKANGAGFDLAVYRGGSTFEVLKNYAAKSDFAVGVHALALAVVTVAGTDYWRFSIDGAPVVDVAIAGGYITPSTTSAVSLGCTDAPDSPLHGTAYEFAAWTSVLSNASLVALSTPPTSTHALAISSTTGVPQIYVQARRYDPSFPTVLPALGVPANMACSGVTRLDY